MKLFSPQFTHDEAIPTKYTCDGEDISPPLSWEDFPSNTKTFTLIMDDPDAPIGTWVHWIIYDIPVNKNHLEENIVKRKNLSGGVKQGRNSWKKFGYGGPCPPTGQHRYIFKCFALDQSLELKAGITKKSLLKAMQGHILDQQKLVGVYKRVR